MDQYRSKDWARFRGEVMRLDDFTCTICGRKSGPGVVLQVHHNRYISGLKPWEYPHDQCATVCKGCHAAEHGIIPPKVGWVHVGWDDLGDLSGLCEYCGTEIRYAFLVQHAKWRTMEVGEICCDNLTSTTLASSEMESQRRYLSRRKTFVSSKRWKSMDSRHDLITHKRFRIEVIHTMQGMRLKIDGQMGKQLFPTAVDAKMKAFDVVESGALKKYLQKRNSKRQPKQSPRPFS